jgi:hypothetical protein
MKTLKVLDNFRTNELSLIPGGYTVVVEMKDGKQFEYDKIKRPNAYIRATLRNDEVKRAWIKDMQTQ